MNQRKTITPKYHSLNINTISSKLETAKLKPTNVSKIKKRINKRAVNKVWDELKTLAKTNRIKEEAQKNHQLEQNINLLNLRNRVSEKAEGLNIQLKNK